MSQEAQQHKALGNQAFQAKDYATAIEHFTRAIEADPSDHVFFSNRSACYSSLSRYEEALADATQCVSLKPDWSRGYNRKGLAEFYLDKYDEAIASYKKGLELEPENAQLKEGLSRAQEKKAEGSNPMASLFTGENLMKLQANPRTAAYFQDPSFVQMLTLAQQNPQMLNMLMQDKRVMDCLGVILGVEMSAAPETPPPPPSSYTPPPPPPPKEEVKKELSQAEQLKEDGNKAYRAKKYDEALACYDKALEIEPQKIVYINNKAAVYFAQKDFEKCVELCDEAVAKGREVYADYSMIGRAFSRKAMALDQLGRLDEAVASYKQSLAEFSDDKVKFALRDLEKKKKKQDELAYINPELGEEHNTKANDKFKGGDFPGALTEYDEAIRRNPSCAKFYANRSAAYIKLMEPTRALTDIDKSLELDPQYVKAYIRKGTVHTMLKEYHKALEAYEKGIKIDPENLELKQGYQKVMMAINTSGSDEERVKHAMADPEIQGLMMDPQIQQVLRDLQERPQMAQSYLADERIRNAINKLVAAGVIRMG